MIFRASVHLVTFEEKPMVLIGRHGRRPLRRPSCPVERERRQQLDPSVVGPLSMCARIRSRHMSRACIRRVESSTLWIGKLSGYGEDFADKLGLRLWLRLSAHGNEWQITTVNLAGEETAINRTSSPAVGHRGRSNTVRADKTGTGPRCSSLDNNWRSGALAGPATTA